MRIAAAAVLVGLMSSAMAATEKPCASADHRAFDFWVGDWKVSPTKDASKAAGTNRVLLLHDGCVVEENWTDSQGGTGQSQNIFAGGKWHQIWVDSDGGLLEMEGGLVGTDMVMTTPVPTDWGGKGSHLQRITWTPNADGSVRQHGERSADEGKTWTTNFDLTYRRSG